MPIVEALMSKLVAQYGQKRGESVYYAMEAEGSGPFGPRGKHRSLHEAWAAKHGVQPTSGKKKPATKARRRR